MPPIKPRTPFKPPVVELSPILESSSLVDVEDLSGQVTVVDSKGRETVRHINAEGDMIPLPPARRGGAPRNKTKARAARKARRKNRRT